MVIHVQVTPKLLSLKSKYIDLPTQTIAIQCKYIEIIAIFVRSAKKQLCGCAPEFNGCHEMKRVENQSLI